MQSSEVVLTAGDVAAAVGGQLASGQATTRIHGFSIDTRTLVAGDVFIAIKGERLDGEAFVGAALEGGALGIIATRAPTELGPRVAGAVWIVATDTTRALQDLANVVRRQAGAQVVAITGSAGKTTTKEAAAEFLATRYRVFRNRGNLNNHIGLPLSLLELRHRPEIAVVELGMNHPGEIRRLVEIGEPDVRVWTNVGEAHLEFFSSVDAIADAKAEILESAASDAVLVANADDPRVMARAGRFAGRTVTFGIERDAHVRALAVRELGIDGTEAEVITSSARATLRTSLIGRGNFANVLAATAVALHYEIPMEVIVERTKVLKPAPRRGEVTRLANGTVVIDDSYNSNPQALERALAVIAQESRFARRVAVVGEMLELGPRSEELHGRCGRVAARVGLHRLVTVGGPAARKLGEAAVAAGMSSTAVTYVATSDAAADLVARLVQPGDLVLVKGSRGVRTDVIVDRIKAEED